METEYLNIHQSLIEGCRAGEARAQTELYNIYCKSMYNVSLRITGNSADAEDVMQEAFLSAFRKIGSYEGKVSFGAWLRRIVINRSLDCLKKRKVRFEEVTERNGGMEPGGGGPGESELLQIRRAIASLPDGYRVVLTLHLIEGYPHEEISKMLHISHSAVRTQYMRAKNRLKEMVRKEDVFSYN